MKERKKLILIILLIILFIILSCLIFNDMLNGLDNFIYEKIIGIKSNWLSSFFKLITMLGNPLILILESLIITLIDYKNKDSHLISINLALVYLINEGLKFIFKRPRPIGINLIVENGFSFPSGHAMVCLAFYGYLAYLLCQKIDKKYAKYVWTCFSVLILMIGISRIYLGVHYFSDILGGLVLGSCYLVSFILVIKKSGC